MNSFQKRFWLFMLACIPARIALGYVAGKLSGQNLRYMAYGATILAIIWIILALFGWRKKGLETFGAPIWWTPYLRIIHAIFYLVFAYMAYYEKPHYNYVLYADAFVGFVSFIIYHAINGDFKYLF